MKYIETMPKCHFCRKSGLYTEMIDCMLYSMHPTCGHRLLFTTSMVREFKNCSACQRTGSLPAKDDLRNHLFDNHTKEALVDLIVDSIYQI